MLNRLALKTLALPTLAAAALFAVAGCNHSSNDPNHTARTAPDRNTGAPITGSTIDTPPGVDGPMRGTDAGAPGRN